MTTRTSARTRVPKSKPASGAPSTSGEGQDTTTALPGLMLDPGPAPAPRAPAVDPLELVRKIAEAAWDKKARKMVALDVRELAGYTDYFVICSGNNDRQVVAIAKNVEEVLRRDLKTKPVAVEGKREGRWVIADFGDVILHVFQEPVREFYALDKLWVDAPKVELEEPEWVRLGE